MKRVFAILLCFSMWGSNLYTDEAADLQDKNTQVDSLVGTWIKEDSPGAAIVVLQGDRILHSKGYGLADLKKKTSITVDTVFDLGSVSKHFTAAAVLLLAERGKLSLTDTLSHFFPKFPSYAQNITVHDLIVQTSGLRDYEEILLKEGKINLNYPVEVKNTLYDYEPTSRDILKLLSGQPLLRFPPGSRWEYSNSGYVVLGQIVESISGKTLPEFLQENIFAPLNMTNTVMYSEKKPEIGNRALSYSRNKGTYENKDYTPLNYIYGDGSLLSTANDLVKWFQALGDDSIFSQSTRQEMFRSSELKNGERTGYGGGWFVATSLGLRRVSHTGSWAGFRNLVVYYPDLQFAIILLSNSDRLDYTARSRISIQIPRIYLKDRMQLPQPVVLTEPELRSFAGRYESEGGDEFKIILENGTLVLHELDHPPIALLADSGLHFFLDGAEDETLFFERNSKGKVINVERTHCQYGYSGMAKSRAKKIS